MNESTFAALLLLYNAQVPSLSKNSKCRSNFVWLIIHPHTATLCCCIHNLYAIFFLNMRNKIGSPCSSRMLETHVKLRDPLLQLAVHRPAGQSRVYQTSWSKYIKIKSKSRYASVSSGYAQWLAARTPPHTHTAAVEVVHWSEIQVLNRFTQICWVLTEQQSNRHEEEAHRVHQRCHADPTSRPQP